MSEMAADEYKRDADFFTAMWETLSDEKESNVAHDERRNWTRFPFCSVQLAASLDGDAMPPTEAFETIRCHDISRGGISYFAKHEPESENVVVIVQTDHVRYCIEGHIVYSRPVYRGGEIQHLVGCQFTRRMKAVT